MSTITLVVGISIGCLDLTLGLLNGPSRFVSFDQLLPPLFATSILASLLCLTVLAASAVGSRWLKLTPLLVAAGCFVGAMLSLALLAGLTGFGTLLTFDGLLRASLLGISSLGFSALAYSWAGSAAPHQIGLCARLACALPFLAAQTLLLVWLNKYHLASITSPASLLVLALYLVTVSATLFAATLPRNLRVHVRLVAALAILVLVGPVFTGLGGASFPAALVSGVIRDQAVSHVIVLTVDSLRADALSCYDPQRGSSPNVDRLARDGILFRSAFSPAPWTLPSFASLFTGLAPAVHGAVSRFSRLPEGVETLAERLAEHGFATAAVGRNTFLTPSFNLDQGFQAYEFFPKHRWDATVGGRLVEPWLPTTLRSDATTADLTALATEWLEVNRDRRFFLWVHYFDPHYPYQLPSEFLPPKGSATIGAEFHGLGDIRKGFFVPSLAERAAIRELYQAEVRYVDEGIGTVLDALEDLGLYENALILFTSDHGEEFWEHGGYEHGHTLYNELLHVPLIVKPPGGTGGLEVDHFVSIESVTPTILDLAAVPYDVGQISGRSLVPAWRARPQQFTERPIVSTSLLVYEDRESIIEGGFKFIRTLVTGREELYDLRVDPAETRSVLERSPELAAGLREALQVHRDQSARLRTDRGLNGTDRVTLDHETRDLLRTLGYVP